MTTTHIWPASSQREALRNASEGQGNPGVRREGGQRRCWREGRLAARSRRWGAAGQPAHRPNPHRPTGRMLRPKKAKVVSQSLPGFLSWACQIPSPPHPRPLILLCLPPPASNSWTSLRVPSAEHTVFCSPEEPSGDL